MELSTVAAAIQERLNILLNSETYINKLGEKELALIMRTLCLTYFNIVKQESLLFDMLSDFSDKVPLDAWPLLNLPSSKLEGILTISP